MKVTDDKAVESWVERLASAGIFVPRQHVTMETADYLLSHANPDQLHAAVHFAYHMHTAKMCAEAETKQQMGQDDPKSEQAAQ